MVQVPDTEVASPTVVERIRAAMVRGDYAPNQRLIEADLCEQYGANRAVIRSALQDLAADGLVEIQRNKGARVRAVSLAEAIEITEARMVLEGLVARKAAEHCSIEDAEELLEIGRAISRMRRCRRAFRSEYASSSERS